MDTLIEALDEELPLRLFAAEVIALLLPQAPRLNPHAPDETRRRELEALRQWWSRNRQKVLDEWLIGRLAQAGYLEGHSPPAPGRLIEALLATLTDEDLVLRFHAHRRLKELFGKEPGAIGHRYHIRIKPLTTYSKIQNLWLMPSRFRYSQWAHFVQRIKEIDPETYEEMLNLARSGQDPLQAIVGKVYEWEETFVPTGINKRPTRMMLPVRPITGEELQKYVSEAGEITGEEVYLP